MAIDSRLVRLRRTRSTPIDTLRRDVAVIKCGHCRRGRWRSSAGAVVVLVGLMLLHRSGHRNAPRESEQQRAHTEHTHTHVCEHTSTFTGVAQEGCALCSTSMEVASSVFSSNSLSLSATDTALSLREKDTPCVCAAVSGSRMAELCASGDALPF